MKQEKQREEILFDLFVDDASATLSHHCAFGGNRCIETYSFNHCCMWRQVNKNNNKRFSLFTICLIRVEEALTALKSSLIFTPGPMIFHVFTEDHLREEFTIRVRLMSTQRNELNDLD